MLTFNHTCIGFSHLASGKPCQDASYSETSDRMSIAIVSDGHGGHMHFRSDIGSQFAIEAAITIIQTKLSDWKNPNERPNLYTLLHAYWKHAVLQHFSDYPLNDDEREVLITAHIEPDDLPIDLVTTLYGCTLMAACVYPGGWFAFQIGDGKCVTINRIQACSDSSENNSTFYIPKMVAEPIPIDDRCFLNITTSLCDPDAATEFRFCGGDEASAPVAIFLGSDGIDNSWGTEEALHNFYIEVLKRCTSAKDVTRDLTEALPKLSQAGSQDDMSVAAIVDKDLLAKNIAFLIHYQIIRYQQDINEYTQRKEHLASLIISLKQQVKLPENENNEHIQRDIDYHYRQLEKVTTTIKRLSKHLSRLQSQIYAYHHSDLARP